MKPISADKIRYLEQQRGRLKDLLRGFVGNPTDHKMDALMIALTKYQEDYFDN